MNFFKKINNWVSEHKLLSGLAGTFLIIISTILFTKTGADQSGNITFGDNTELNNSPVAGRDIHITEENLTPKSQSDSLTNQQKPNGSKEKDSTKLNPEKSSLPESEKKEEINKRYVAGRDININEKDQSELIKVLVRRAKNINKTLQDFYHFSEVSEVLDEFNELHKDHIVALRNNDFVLAHEILSQIHRLSFHLDSEEEQAQQINLYGDITSQYATSLDRDDIIGGIASLYFNKNINPYDSTEYAGNVVYYNKLKYKWPAYPSNPDSIKVFYYRNFLNK